MAKRPSAGVNDAVALDLPSRPVGYCPRCKKKVDAGVLRDGDRRISVCNNPDAIYAKDAADHWMKQPLTMQDAAPTEERTLMSRVRAAEKPPKVNLLSSVE